jgi:hypothetical protein
MPSVNTRREGGQITLFDQFYNRELVVAANDYDMVYSFFYKTMNNAESAAEFTYIIFQLVKDTGAAPATFIESLKGQDEITLTMSMAYYLNARRSRSTLLGIGHITTPNYYAARNVVP